MRGHVQDAFDAVLVAAIVAALLAFGAMVALQTLASA